MEGVDTVADPKVRVSPAAAKRRKSEGASTETENMNLKARSIEDAVTAAVAKIDGVPAWVGPAMGEVMATFGASTETENMDLQARSIEDAVTAAVGKIDDVPAMGEALATTLAPVNARLTSLEQQLPQAIATALAPVNARLINLEQQLPQAIATALAPVNARLTNIEGQLTNIEGQLTNIQARQANFLVVDCEDLLQPLNNAAGVPFPNFPGTFRDLARMTNLEMSTFLAHYGLAVEEEDRFLMRRQIKKFIGMRIT